MMSFVRWSLAIVAVIGACTIWYYQGVEDGERGLNYWAGWQDAMTQTDYGKIPVQKKTL